MRLGTTAAVFVGALALVLPAAGPSVADDRGDRSLGTLQYRYRGDAGERQGQIQPSAVGTCYLLTGTSLNEPAVDVRNRTRSRALLFDNPGCSGRAVATLRPNGSVSEVKVVAALFQSADEAGQEPGRGDWNNGGEQGQGRGDWANGGDQGQGRGDQNGEDAADEDAAEGSDGADQGQGRGDWGNGAEQGQGGRGDEADADAEEEEEGEEGEEAEEAEDAEDGEEAETDVEEDFLSMVLRAIG
ncbi:hypothetical protein AB0N09_20860 [Streptomyces erythrochromogenes]|uniref:hypothetical protein n=1 Tax=Streptomyces erythrochromogenes TaxID=285574 RepID=UPI003434848E